MTLSRSPQIRYVLALCSAGLLLASAGCAGGSDNEPQVDEAVTSDSSSQTSTDNAAEPSPDNDRQDDSEETTAAQRRTVEVAGDGTYVISGDQASFVMPSGNIQCVMRTGSVVCQISQKRFEPAEADLSDAVLGDCSTSSADALTLLDNDVASWTCTSETIRGQASIDLGGWWAADDVGETETVDRKDLAVLNYGQAMQLGSILCSSESTGISCRDTASAAGFTLARESYTTS